MSKETTPKQITDIIDNFCKMISPETTPNYVPVYLFPEMKMNECFHNVDAVIKESGGKAITGWAIWQWPNILIEAEAHAIWESPEGRRIDVTPHTYNENSILFLPDSSLHYTGTTIPSHRMGLTTSPLVGELISLLAQKDQIAANSSGQTYALPMNLAKRINELLKLFHQSAGRNDPCPCGSGLKYKKCCGQYK